MNEEEKMGTNVNNERNKHRRVPRVQVLKEYWKIELIRIQNGDYNPTISLRLTGIDEAIKDLLTTQPPK